MDSESEPSEAASSLPTQLRRLPGVKELLNLLSRPCSPSSRTDMSISTDREMPETLHLSDMCGDHRGVRALEAKAKIIEKALECACDCEGGGAGAAMAGLRIEELAGCNVNGSVEIGRICWCVICCLPPNNRDER